MERNNTIREAVIDELKLLAALREDCVLRFRAENGGTATVQSKIQDVFEDADGQYLFTQNGLTLQLHQLIAINGKPLAHFC